LGGWVDYSVTEDLMLHAALGYFAVNEIPSKNWDKHVGTEFDLGLKYNIMSNLSYQLDAGYFWTGDYYKMGVEHQRRGQRLLHQKHPADQLLS
jgi:hypothetical protein